MDEVWVQLGGIAKKIAALGQELINEHTPGAVLDESNPKYKEMMRLYKQTHEVCEAESERIVGQLQELEAKGKALIAERQADVNARMVAAGMEDQVPPEEVEKIKAANAAAATPPLAALPFADEHESPPAEVEELLPRLIQLPKQHLGMPV
jgi:hypothetical protein